MSPAVGRAAAGRRKPRMFLSEAKGTNEGRASGSGRSSLPVARTKFTTAEAAKIAISYRNISHPPVPYT
jgi:hypothetical protein